MDIISNKLAAYILDKGTHAEWAFDASKEPGHIAVIQTVAEEHYSVNASALVFSLGMQTEYDGVELILGISPVSDMTFAFDNADCYSPAELFEFRNSITSRCRGSAISIPDANCYRMIFRHMFGFDCQVTNTASALTINRNRSAASDFKLYTSDPQCSRLKDVVYENDAGLSKEMDQVGFRFVALRRRTAEGPLPVFWANGHYTRNASEEDENVFRIVNLAVTSHLHTRYLSALLKPAANFCPHLLV